MEKLSREYIKKLIYEAINKQEIATAAISRTRVKEIILEEIVERYGAK
tara:strand:+ start:249 stop:392 length:144 start_codon:yes stop_codon:yes gene_type:complete